MPEPQLDVPVDEPVETSTAPEPEAAPRPARSTGFIIATVAAVLFAALAVLFAALLVQSNRDREDAVEAGDEAVDERREVALVAGQLGEALLSYDYADPDAAHQEVVALSADPFLGQYEQAFPALNEYFAQVQGAASAAVKDVFVSEIDAGTATAVVVADRLVTDTGGTRQESDVYIRVDIAEIEGTWKVVGVTNLNLALSSTDLGDGDDPASSTTTAPASPSG